MSMIIIDRVVVERALEALEKPSNLVIRSLSVNEAIRSLRNALAQPEQPAQDPAKLCPYAEDDNKRDAWIEGYEAAQGTSQQAQPLTSDEIEEADEDRGIPKDAP